MKNSNRGAWLICAATCWPVSQAWADAPATQPADRYLEAVRTFADNALQYGRDTYGPKHTPLFADGLNVDTHEPPIWELPRENAENWKMPRRWIMCNVASQQNFYRTLVALSELTRDPRYRQAAVDSLRYAFAHLRHESGLMFWGGHAAWDLDTDQPVGESRTDGIAGRHEFKRSYPFYELMWEVDPKATRAFIESLWTNHILDWSNLDFNRHAKYNPVPPAPWDHEYVGGPIPFIGRGLTFIHTGSDLYYAGAMLSLLDNDPKPMVWARRMAQRYHDACHPKTGLGADNFSEEQTRRFVKQFGQEFGERLTEATFTSVYRARYRYATVCQLKLADRLGQAGDDFGRWAVADLTAYAKHAYDPSDNTFRATLIDGTKLSPADRKHEGYVRADWLGQHAPAGHNFWAYALAYLRTGDHLMWDMVRDIGRGFDLGEFGATPGSPGKVNLGTRAEDPILVFALLDLYTGTKERAYLDLARQVGTNLVAGQFHKGFFVPSQDHLFCKFDTVTPLALLYLEAALSGSPARLPAYCGSASFFHCPFEGLGRTYDNDAIYARLRK